MPLAGTTSDCWDQVDDFNWLKTGHSPNWRILEPEDRIEADHWKRLPAITEAEAGDVLQIFGATGPNDQHEASKRPIVA